MLFALDGKRPVVHPTAFVAPTAVLIGDVVVAQDASVWFHAVLRGDSGQLVVGEGSNVQDGSVLHEGVVLGKGCVLGHQVLVHESVLGDSVLVGNGAKVMAATVGDNAIIAAGAVLLGPADVPPGAMWVGIPAKQLREASEKHQEMVRQTAENYRRRRAQYLAGLQPADAEAEAYLKARGV
jgi:carbonic anhydrase/acetyltransferase-like protein (isoleucine patch superfamily)